MATRIPKNTPVSPPTQLSSTPLATADKSEKAEQSKLAPLGSLLPAGLSQASVPKAIDPSLSVKDGELMVATYNVENLFPTVKDKDKEYDQFTPAGEYNWTEPKLAQKLQNIGKVVREVNGGRGPDILTLSEVANRQLLERLHDEALADLGYKTVVHRETDDWRGIDNAILSRHQLLEDPKLHNFHDPKDPVWGTDVTRGILEATFDAHGVPLTVLVVHFPRNLDNARRQKQRLAAANALKNVVANLEAENPNREIMILGDFNSNPGNRDLGPSGLAASADPQAVRSGQESAKVYNTLACLADQVAASKSNKRVTKLEDVDAVLKVHGDEIGTNRWEDEWYSLDHILVSKGLLDEEGLSWIPGSTQVVRKAYMQGKDGSPKPQFDPNKEPKDHAPEDLGYSDHFPVVTRLKVNKPKP